MGRPATDKKERLIEAAMRRFHHDGIAASSLVTVANDAGVPPGNVYYYFRSKDALTDEVIDRWCAKLRESLDRLETVTDPRTRVRDFIASAGQRRQVYADFGCPLAALNSDLRNAPAAIATSSGRPLAMLREWLTVQFAQIVDTEAATGHADFCMSSLQGSYTLAHAVGDPYIVARTVDHLLTWINKVRPDQI